MFPGIVSVFYPGAAIGCGEQIDSSLASMLMWSSTQDIQWIRKAVVYLLKRDHEAKFSSTPPPRKRRRVK
jgi:hypothetical protein